MRISPLVYTVLVALMLGLISVDDVKAMEVSVDCRVRDKARSEITVLGIGFRPWKRQGTRKVKIKYYAMVYSGNGSHAISRPKANNSNRQLEYYFDSDISNLGPRDTQISPFFIENATVTAEIRLQGKNTRLVAFINAQCREDD